MSRRQEKPFFDELFDLLKLTPTWVGPVLAVLAYVLFEFVIPLFIPAPKTGAIDSGMLVRQLMPTFAKLFAGLIILVWIAAEISKLSSRRLFDRHTGLESIRNISWREFERLVSEAYRRRGYLAEVVGSASGDGGVDIELHGHGEKVLVQCKRWRSYKVGVTTVRELLGVVVSQRADRGVVVTSG